jgi:uncharacterized repeat protein (TIGR01451 family)
VCTTDSCDSVAGCITSPVANGSSCSDGNLCNGDETCQAGTCTVGTPLNCNDANVCTSDSCNPASGCQNVAVANGTACVDGNLCNGNETCQGGVCTAGAPLNCNDSNICTADTCGATTGCSNTPVLNGSSCTDGNVCNGPEICQSGTCTGGTPINCNDNNVCTTDGCDPVFGCTNTAVLNATPCPDTNVCNGAETCQAGVCATGTPLNCNDSNVCTADTCNPVTGCTNAPVLNGTACDDGDECNGDETCQAGVCSGAPPVNCDDGNPCTTDTCDAVLGCQNIPVSNGSPCLDGNLCNGAESCQAGTCTAGTALNCNDTNVCTNDSCDPASGCVNTPVVNGLPCLDGNVCNGSESCQAGACTPGTALNCNDSNICTTDTCDPISGCGNAAVLNGTTCSDGDVCNGGELCQAGVCTPGTPLSCNDSNVCTTDTCAPLFGCQNAPVLNGTLCLDTNVCNGTETCQGGVCAGGTALNCNDLNLCTTDSCDPIAGCQNPAVLNGTPCTDGNLCNGNEICQTGACAPGTPLNCDDGNACTTNGCDAVFGCTATPVLNNTPCGDGDVCNGNERCQSGVCIPGVSLDCNDANACTVDNCDPVTGCVNTAIPACTPCNVDIDCNDGNQCTSDICTAGVCGNPLFPDGTTCGDSNVCNGTETCQVGVCTAGTPLSCDDLNVCTADNCDPVFGCENIAVPNSTPCPDGDLCNGDELCANGICLSGLAPNCNDGNVCTTDSCDLLFGCINTPLINGSPCLDGDVCNGAESCQGAICTSSAPLNCNDGDLCTDDLCDPIFGCFQSFNTVPCDDGAFCTVGEVCLNGACGAGVPRNCSNLDDQCNVGTCNETSDACETTPANEGQACLSGTTCIANETCSGGVCTNGTLLPPEHCFSPRVFVVNSGDDTMSIMRVSDMTVEGAVPTGVLPAAIAVHPDGTLAYITNNIDDTVTVISLESFNTVETIPVDAGPVGVAVTPDGELLYVANNIDDTISVITTADTTVATTIELDPLDELPPFGPIGVAVSRGGDFLYVTNNRADSVSVFRVVDNAFVAELPVGRRPQGIAASPNGLFMYVAHTGDDNVGVIRILDNAMIGLIFVGSEPTDVTFTPDGQFAYVTNSVSNTLSKIRTSGVPTLIATIPVGALPAGVVVTPRGNSVCVANTGSNSVSLVGVTSNQVTATAGVGIAPFGLAIRPQSVLSVAASVSPTPVQPGNQLTITITFSNIGEKSAQSVLLSATIPANTTFVSASAGGVLSGSEVRWPIGMLLGGQSGTQTLVLAVDNPLPPGTTLTSTVTITDDEAETIQAFASANVESDPQYSLAKTDGSDPIAAGNTLTYTITYANNASANADGEGVTITEVYDPRVTFVSASPPPVAGTNNQWNIGDLPLGASGTINLTTAVASPLPNGTILQNEVRLSDAFGSQVVATQNTTIASSPTLNVGIVDDTDPVAAGSQFTYTVNYTNTGNENASNVVASMTYDPNVIFVSATPAPDFGTNDTWTIGNLNVGASGMIMVTVEVIPVIANGTIMTSPISITDGVAFASAAATTIVSSAASLNVMITDAPDPILTGDTLTYTITYANGGTDVAPGAVILMTYDPGTTFVSSVPPPSVGNNQWDLGNVPVGGSGTIVITVQVTAPLGSIVSSQAVLSDLVGNSSSASTNTTIQAVPVLSMTVVDSADPVSAGGNFTYTFRYGNNGNAPSASTLVTTVYDPNCTFISAVPAPDPGTNNQWTIGALNNGTTNEINVMVQVNAPLPLGTILTTQSTVTAAGGLIANDSENTLVESQPNLSIATVDDADPTLPGGTLGYTISYANTGNDSTSGVVISAAYDSQLTFVSSVPAPDSGTNNQWTIGTLDGGTSGTIDVTLAVPQSANGTIVTNQVTLTDFLSRSASASETTTISSPAFNITATDSVDPVESEDEVTFVFSYENALGLLQPGVMVSASYDSRFIVEQTTPPADPGTDNVWSLGTLSAGQTGIISVRGRFVTLFDASPAMTTAQISSGGGTAYASQMTSVQPKPSVDRYRVLLRKSPNKDRWRVGANFVVSGGMDPTGEEVSVKVVDLTGNGHISELLVDEVPLGRRGRFRFKGSVDDNGFVRIRLRGGAAGENWRFRVVAQGSDILPPFLADKKFQIVIRVGDNVFLSPVGTLRESGTGGTRGFP